MGTEFRTGDRVRCYRLGFTAEGVVTVAKPYAHELPPGADPSEWVMVRLDRDRNAYPHRVSHVDLVDESDDLAVVRDMPDPRDDALDLIADAAGKYGDPGPGGTFDALFETVVDVLHRTGREV